MPSCFPLSCSIFIIHAPRYNVKVKGMEGNMEAVPHIDRLREIQPLVLDGISYSKVLRPATFPHVVSSLAPHVCRRFFCNS